MLRNIPRIFQLFLIAFFFTTGVVKSSNNPFFDSSTPVQVTNLVISVDGFEVRLKIAEPEWMRLDNEKQELLTLEMGNCG